VGAAFCFSECAVEQGGVQIDDQRVLGVDVVVRGVFTGEFPGCGPCPRAAACTAARDLSASLAGVSIIRETVGSEAAGPNTPDSARTVAISARQSPPRATATARSQTIFPGSWIVVGRRHPDTSRVDLQQRVGAGSLAHQKGAPELVWK
jgi:hypothetical protein